MEHDDPGYWARAVLRQDVSAVTGACLLTKKALYDQLGGLDEQFCVAFNDVDYCLRAREAGMLVVLEPDALLYHYESITRGSDDASSNPANYARFLHEQGLLRSRWSTYFALGDPYFTPYCSQPW
jgi:GT2 family glycosyltransferase